LRRYPCEWLFIHRDAEKLSWEARYKEIEDALAALPNALPPVVCVIPVRMQEAWLLFDERAIRSAAGNPNGSYDLKLPRLRDLEGLPDPKTVLHDALRAASGLNARRREQFKPQQAAIRLADVIKDYVPLRELHAFQRLEADMVATMQTQGWLR
jgi:hypothetical protein